MYTPVYTRQFEKDAKRCQRRGKDMEKFKALAKALIAGQPLDPSRRDHGLAGDYAGRRGCHIEPDWLLIYKVDGQRLIFERMGAHSDLFRR